MKLVLLGASGQTGQCVIQQSLDHGHTVCAVVRNRSKIQLEHERLEVLEGDIFSETFMSTIVKDADVVISTLGFSPFSRPVTGYLAATKAVATAMDKSDGSKRLILMHSWYSDPKSRAGAPSFFLRWILLPIINPCLDNMQLAENFLRDECNLDWTTVLPAGLNNGPMTSGEFRVEEDAYEIKGASGRISRADVARFIVKVAETPGVHTKKTVAIAI